MSVIDLVQVGLDDILSRRPPPSNSGTAINHVELNGGRMVPLYAYEPDPTTSRESYYYNTAENRLYRLVKQRQKQKHKPFNGVIIAHWKAIGG